VQVRVIWRCIVGHDAPPSVGRIYRVVRRDDCARYIAWRIDPPLTGAKWQADWVADCALRPPFRDPGDDATDEMTRIAGKPTEEQDRLWAEFDTAMSELEKRLA
jgi:hypothetical protein